MEPSRLVVLASGVGTRLRGNGAPKPLAEIAGLSLIERTLATAKSAGFDEVVVVTGHRGDEVDRCVLDASRRRGIPVRVVRNHRFLEGNGLSALAARALVAKQPFALVMADHVFAPALLERLRHTSVAPGQVAVVIDHSYGAITGVDGADAMKVAVDGDLVEEIGKDLHHYDAFDVGAFVCTDALFDAVEIAAASGDSTLAGAIRVMASAGAATAVPLEEGEWWFDVDTPKDLRRARGHLFRSTAKPLDGAIVARVNRLVSQRLTTPLLLTLFPTVTPNQVTVAALAAACAAAASFVAGRTIAAALFVTLASILDGSDGEVARLAHRRSSYGGFLDAVLDRASDGLMLVAAGVHLATTPRLASTLGAAQVWVGVLAAGLAAVTHLLVSYTTAKAKTDLDHSFHGAVLGGGKGRDVRLLILTAGAVGAAFHSLALLAALVVIALLCVVIVVVRLRASWWAAGPGAPYVGVRAVALDFDGTVADSMDALSDQAVRLLSSELGIDPQEALQRYCATAGIDFRGQLDQIAPGHPRLTAVATMFEDANWATIAACDVFADVATAVTSLQKDGLPVLLCTSTRVELVRRFCEQHGLHGLIAIDGWSRARPKAVQLTDWTASLGISADELLFVGDTFHDAQVARALGTRFVGICRPGRRDLLAGSGAPVLTSLDELGAAVLRARRSTVSLGGSETHTHQHDGSGHATPSVHMDIRHAELRREQGGAPAVDQAHLEGSQT